jgi:hypothetical protein
MSVAAARSLLAVLIFLAGSSLALGQAGSTGGSIGKTDKSVSGETAPEKQTQPKSRSKGQRTNEKANSNSAASSSTKSPSGATPCERLLGSWTFSNGIGVVFKADGGTVATNDDEGKWTCDSGMVTAQWSKWTDHYVISSDGAHISGTSGLLGMALTAIKN